MQNWESAFSVLPGTELPYRLHGVVTEVGDEDTFLRGRTELANAERSRSLCPPKTQPTRLRSNSMFKLVVMKGRTPHYLAVHCVPLSSQRHLHSAERNLLPPTQHVRPPPGFCHCWSVRLEQSSGPCPQPEHHRSCFQAPAKDISVRMVLAHPVH